MAPYRADMSFPTTILVVNSAGLGLALFAIVLRFWSQATRGTKHNLSDYMIVASWLFTLGLVVSENFCVTRGGVGQPTAIVTLDQLLFSAKQFVVIGVTGTMAVTLVKISLLDFFISIFGAISHFKPVAYTLMGLTACYGISITIVTLAGCRPFAANWDKISYPNYQCINTSQFYISQGAIGAFLDITILLLPLPAIWKLQLKTSKKVAISFLFTIGILICAVSLTRLVYNTRQDYMLTHFTEYAGIVALLGALEANLSIVCACLPMLQSIFVSFGQGLRSKLSIDRSTLKLLKPFSSGSRKPTHGSQKLGSFTDNAKLSTDQNSLEAARNQSQHDRLYPLTALSASRASFDEHVEGTTPLNEFRTVPDAMSHANTSTARSVASPTRAVSSQQSINVTRTWDIRDERERV